MVRIAEEGTPGWQKTDFSVAYHSRRFDAQLGLQNLFDEAYRILRSGIDGLGRSIWISVNLKVFHSKFQ